jgi:ectoine hydroxylase-related dioxygenase (phytanoyl-CoA dioxygenase family)
MPDMLTPAHVKELRRELEVLRTRDSEANPLKKVARGIQFAGGALTELIAHPPMIRFLRQLFGDEVILMSYDYSRSMPNAPAINLHADGQPWGSKIFGPEHSCPRLIRVLYYLEDLTPERAPFRVVPRSHLSFHSQANPYLRYKEHPEQVMICCQAGTAALINQNVFHGNFPNRTDGPRELLGLAYRPAWAGPSSQVEEWSQDLLAKVSPEVRELMHSRNTRIWEYDAPSVRPNMPSNAPGISPSRWDWK